MCVRVRVFVYVMEMMLFESSSSDRLHKHSVNLSDFYTISECVIESTVSGIEYKCLLINDKCIVPGFVLH